VQNELPSRHTGFVCPKQTDRQIDRHRQRERERDRERERERERETRERFFRAITMIERGLERRGRQSIGNFCIAMGIKDKSPR